MWYTQDSRGHILALASGQKTFKHFKWFPFARQREVRVCVTTSDGGLGIAFVGQDFGGLGLGVYGSGFRVSGFGVWASEFEI